MSRWTRLMPAVIFAALLAGCGESALDDSITLPVGPAFDGGGYATGGNLVGDPEDETETTTTTATQPADDDGGAEEEERGGYAVGGN
jgi:hypothetical protein